MQKFIIVASLISCLTGLCLLTSCSKQGLPIAPQPSAFSAALRSGAELPAAGGKDTILINGGTNGWWVTLPSSNWMVVSKLYGSGDFKLPVEVKANNTGAARDIDITVSPTFGQAVVVIKVKQAK